MGFFDGVKKALNIGGVKVSISTPGSVANGTTLEAQVTVTAGKMAQTVTQVEVKLSESDAKKQYGMGGNASQSTMTTVLGKQLFSETMALQPGEQKTLQVSIPVNAANDVANQGGMMGTLGKLNNMATGRKRVWMLKAIAAIEGSADASNEVAVQITF